MKRNLWIWTFLLACGHACFGGGAVTNLTQADLERALQGGGTVIFATPGTLTLTSSIVIAQDTILDANTNSNFVTISGGNTLRLFQVNTNVSFAAKGLILANGRVVGANGADGDPASPGGDAVGAGVLNQGGTVSLTDCTLSNNVVQGGNAGVDGSGLGSNIAKGGNAMGASLYNLGGNLNVTNCVFTANAATGGVGGISTFPVNQSAGDGGHALGGAVYFSSGMANLQGVTLTNNNANGGVGGHYGGVIRSYANGGMGCGGGLYATSSQIFVHESVLWDNSAVGGGPIDSANPSGDLGGSVTGSGMGGALFFSQFCSASVRLCSFSTNVALSGPGGRLYHAGGGRGGAIFNGGDLQVWDSTFSGNSSAGALGAGVGQGGAICSTNLLAISGSAFVRNQAMGGISDFGPTMPGAGEGGALWSSGLLQATNSTLTANQTEAGYYVVTLSNGSNGPSVGGGMCISAGAASLINVTIAANLAISTNCCGQDFSANSQGGGLSVSFGVVSVRNSIIANNSPGGDVWGTIADAGYNICSDGTAGFSATGSLNEADPMLAALSQNGGPTPTMSLLAGSPARDVIPSDFPLTDQRGVSRPQGTAGDIGAYEADFISAAPAIITQPAGATARAGTNVTFSVQASGTAPLSYQWLKEGHPVSGATQSSLTLSNVQSADAGSYSVVVTNAFGMVPSAPAVLVVDSTPIILSQPASVVIAPGGNASFTVQTDGPSLAYQWWHDSAPVSGATSSTLLIGNAMAGAQGNYLVVVANFAGAITSAPAVLSFDSSVLNILIPPKDQSAESGYPAAFSILVSGIPPFAYQWEHNGTALAGATNSALTLASVSANDAGSYNVVVTNAYRTVTSASAQLTVTPGARPPALSVARFGQSMTITFNAEAGRSYRLLASSNFISWTAQATNAAVNAGLLQFVQPIEPVPGSFYQVVTP